MLRCETARLLVAGAKRLAFAVLVLALVCAVASAQDAARKVNDRYRSERDPVRKAKLLAKLGPLEMEDARAALAQNDAAQALSVLQYYRDEVRRTVSALEAAGVDVEKRPGGFKELQVELRVFLRDLDDLIFSLPVDSRAPFEAVRSDLDNTETTLFVSLFPSAGEKPSRKK